MTLAAYRQARRAYLGSTSLTQRLAAIQQLYDAGVREDRVTEIHSLWSTLYAQRRPKQQPLFEECA